MRGPDDRENPCGDPKVRGLDIRGRDCGIENDRVRACGIENDRAPADPRNEGDENDPRGELNLGCADIPRGDDATRPPPPA